MQSQKAIAYLALLIVTLAWGLTFPVIKLSVNTIDSASFVCLRFALASLVLLPFIISKLKNSSWLLIFDAAILGVFNAASYFSQTQGLHTISASQSAFITGLNVIVVPFLAALVGLGRLRIKSILCALIALIGLYLLTGINSLSIKPGIAWTLLCAISYAAFVVYLQYISRRTKHFTLLTFYQIVFTALLTVPALISHQEVIAWQPNLFIALVYCGVIATAIVLLLQNHFQHHLNPTSAALVYALEPVFAAVFSASIFGMSLGSNIFFGGGMMLLSIILMELPYARKNSAATASP